MKSDDTRKAIIRLPKIYTAGGSLSKKWFIYFYYRNPDTNKMQRFRYYENINTASTESARMAKAKTLCDKYRARLKSGWSPFSEPNTIYEDSLEYKNTAEIYGILKKGSSPFRKLLAEYLGTFEHTRKSTFQTYQSKLRNFAKWLHTKKLIDTHPALFTHEMALEYLDFILKTKNLSSKSYNQYKVIMKSFFNYLKTKGKIKNNPFDGIKKMKEERQIPNFYNRNMIDKIKEYTMASDPMLWTSIELMYYCFIRPGEQRLLQIKHFDLWNGRINIPGTISKNHHPRMVTMPAGFWEKLQSMNLDQYSPEAYFFTTSKKPGAKPVGKNYFYNHYQKIVEALKIPKGFDFYNWKHTGAATAALAGINLESIRQQLGHRSLDQTKEYIEAMVGENTKDFREKHISL